MARTREEVQHLIESWKRDPIWDLEDTEGFEEHREELVAVATTQQAVWAAADKERERKERLRLVHQGIAWGCSPEVVAQLERLGALVDAQARQIAALEEQVYVLQRRLERGS